MRSVDDAVRLFGAHVRCAKASCTCTTPVAVVQDKRLLMWDLRTCQAQARLDVPGQPYGVMDEEGLVFAVGCSSGLVSMFDARSYESGPFLSFPIPLQQHGIHELAPITCMKFSTNQQHLLVVVDGRIFVMDTFDGREVVTWRTGVKSGQGPVEASFSPDGEYAISGVHPAISPAPHIPSTVSSLILSTVKTLICMYVRASTATLPACMP